jgi:hypothetical protein
MAAAETRRTILLSVKEQARLLQEALGDPSSSTGARWSPQQWWQSFTFLVRVRAAAVRLRACAARCLHVPSCSTRCGMLRRRI